VKKIYHLNELSSIKILTYPFQMHVYIFIGIKLLLLPLLFELWKQYLI